MTTRSKMSGMKQARTRWRTIILRCVLLLTAWQGPLPWIHSHGTLVQISETTSQGLALPGLASHLRSHHASTDPFAKVDFGWHLHIEFPNSSNDDPNQPTRSNQDRLLGGATNGPTELITRGAVDSTVHAVVRIDTECVGLMLADPGRSQCPAHFYDAFAASLSLPLRFCVSRC